VPKYSPGRESSWDMIVIGVDPTLTLASRACRAESLCCFSFYTLQCGEVPG